MVIMKTQIKTKGFTLIEVLLTLVIVTVFMGAAVILFLSTFEGTKTTVDYTRASFLVNEGIEAIHAIRDTNYINLEDGTYGLIRDNGYSLISAPEIIDDVYERTVTVESVYRDANGNIAPTGDPDPETKRIIVEVTFPSARIGTRTLSSSTFITNWRAREFVHTLSTDFDPEMTENVEVMSGITPPANNSSITLEKTFVPNGFYSSSNIGSHGNDVVVTPDRKYAFVTTGSSAAGLTVVNIENPNSISVVASLDIKGKGDGMALSGDLLAVAVDNASYGFALVNVSNPAVPVLLSSINILGGAGEKVALTPDNKIAFVTTDRSARGVVVVDISDAGRPRVITSYYVEEDGNGASVGLRDTLLFVGSEARDDGDHGVYVFDVSDVMHPIIVDRVGFDDNEHATGFVFDYPYVFMSLRYGDSELAIGRVDDTGKITLLDQRSITNGDAEDISIGEDLIALGAGDYNRGIVILDINEPSNPEVVEIRDIDMKVNGVEFIPPYIAITTYTANEGFVLIGSGDHGYAASGSYLSKPIDIGSDDPEYLSVSFDGIFPEATSTRIELRAADSIDALNNASWVGPFSQSPSRITLPAGRYFQYRISLAGNGSTTPVFEELKINYLP